MAHCIVNARAHWISDSTADYMIILMMPMSFGRATSCLVYHHFMTLVSVISDPFVQPWLLSLLSIFHDSICIVWISKCISLGFHLEKHHSQPTSLVKQTDSSHSDNVEEPCKHFEFNLSFISNLFCQDQGHFLIRFLNKKHHVIMKRGLPYCKSQCPNKSFPKLHAGHNMGVVMQTMFYHQ